MKSYIVMDAEVIRTLAKEWIHQIEMNWIQKKLDAVQDMRKHWLKKWWYKFSTDEEILEDQLCGAFTDLQMYECFQVLPRLDTARDFIRACEMVLENGDGKIHVTVSELAQLKEYSN